MGKSKIKIILPTSDFPKFRISNPVTGGLCYRKSIKGVWATLEGHFDVIRKASDRHKTAVLVKDGLGYVNESCDSSNPAYLGFAARCFLEDYFRPRMRRNLQKKYPPTDEI